MNIFDALLGRSITMDEAEEELGKPEVAEEHDLPLHVQRCAKRWALSYRASKNNSAQLSQIRIILILMILYGLATTPHWEKISSILQAL
jgi:hypothetical protein